MPSDSKRVLFTPQMEYWLQQWEELRGNSVAERFDLQVCKEAKKVDEATGVPGLTGAGSRRSKFHPKDNSAFLAPPREVADWARVAAETRSPTASPELKIASVDLHFPDRDGQRILTRTLVQLPPNAGFKLSSDAKPSTRLIVEGMVEQEAKAFEDFRMRFQLPAGKPGEPVVLAIDRPLRPKQNYVLRLKIRDEVGGAETWISRGFRVPVDPVPEAAVAGAAVAQGELVPQKTAAGADSLLMLPPTEDVLIGVWRAQAIVTGERIKKVNFLVDGKLQLATSKAPYSAEVRLSSFPTEQTVRAEGYDDAGKLVAADQVILNQPRGGFNVRIVTPAKGTRAQGNRAQTKAEVVVPEGRRLQAMEFRVNDQLVTSLAKPPWQVEVPVPDADLVYLTVVAILDDGTRSEAVRYLRAPQYVSEVDVDLVELYTAVTDRSNNLVDNLKQDDFEVYESGKKQELVKFDQVRNLPLTVCMLIDTSGSMASSLSATQTAAAGFLQSAMKPGDRAFAVSFARRPRLEMRADGRHQCRDPVDLRAPGGRRHRPPRRPGAQPLLLPRGEGATGPGAALGRRRQLELYQLQGRHGVRQPERRRGLRDRPQPDVLRHRDQGEARRARRGERRPGVLHQQPAGAAGDLQADRDRAAQPLPAGLQLHRGGDPDRVPSGRGQGKEVRTSRRGRRRGTTRRGRAGARFRDTMPPCCSAGAPPSPPSS